MTLIHVFYFIALAWTCGYSSVEAERGKREVPHHLNDGNPGWTLNPLDDISFINDTVEALNASDISQNTSKNLEDKARKPPHNSTRTEIIPEIGMPWDHPPGNEALGLHGPSPPNLHFNFSLSEVGAFIDALRYWEEMTCGEEAFCERDQKKRSRLSHCFTCGGCSCDLCNVYSDCCLDRWAENNMSSIPDLSMMACFSGIKDYKSKPSPQSYYFVRKCPESYSDEEIVRNCETSNKNFLVSPQDPPVYSSRSRLNYVNAYCAMCHKELYDDLVEWKTGIVCSAFVDISQIQSREDLFDFVFKHPSCFLTTSPPEGSQFRVCDETIISTCNETGDWVAKDEGHERACAMYENIVTVTSQKYRNIYCALCNGQHAAILKLFQSSCFEGGRPDFTGGVLPFSVIFNLQPLDSSRSPVGDPGSDLVECPRDSVFDPFTGKCRELVCSKGRLIRNHECVDAFLSAKGIGYELRYSLVPEAVPFYMPHDPELFLNGFSHNLLQKMNSEIDILRPSSYVQTLTVCYQEDGHKQFPEVVSVGLVLYLGVGADLPQNVTETKLTHLMCGAWYIYETFWTSRMYPTRHTDPTHGERHDLLCDDHRIVIRPDDAYSLPDHPGNASAFIRVDGFTRCNQIELRSSEYSTNNSTQSIQIKGWKEEIKYTDVLVVENGIRLCVNFSGWYRPRPGYHLESSRIQRRLTVVCFGLSLVFLSLTLLICLLSTARHTVPIQITICLVMTLIIAQLLFLISGYFSSHLWVCRVLGMAIHYSWLTVFAWKSVAAYHMYVAFVKPLQQRHGRIIRKYLLYAFGTPFAFVLCYVLVRLILSKSESIGYGDDVCFLGRPIDIGLAFMAPVGLGLLVNTYCFVRAVYAIQKMSKFEKQSSSRNVSYNSFFLRMSIGLGFTWVVGFVANFVSEPFIWYIFIVLNGGIGILVFLSHVCNRSTVEYLRKVFKRSMQKTSATSTQGSREGSKETKFSDID